MREHLKFKQLLNQFKSLKFEEEYLKDYLMEANELLEEALRLSGEKTKKAAVTKALLEFVARRRQKDLLDLFGRLTWDSSFDYKTERTRS